MTQFMNTLLSKDNSHTRDMFMKIQFSNLIVFILLSFFITSTYAATMVKPIVCAQQYALCTSAPCVPDPRHPDVAICSCVVEKGNSVGYKTCDERAPKQVKFNVMQVISTFSFAQFATKKSMTCAKDMPWTNCVDAPCTVNPMDTTKAICSCKIITNQAFFTFGGDCDSKTCQTGFWSGATTTAATLFRNVLLEKTQDEAASIAKHCTTNH